MIILFHKISARSNTDISLARISLEAIAANLLFFKSLAKEAVTLSK